MDNIVHVIVVADRLRWHPGIHQIQPYITSRCTGTSRYCNL